MGWTERQRAMLAEMGLRVWVPGAEAMPEPTPTSTLERAPQPGIENHAREARAVSEVQAPVSVVARAGEASSATQAPALESRVDIPMTGTRPTGVAGMDWSALREAVAGCTACKLCTGRTQTVFGTGHPRAAWLVVGEAPGEQEDRQGEPFVGKSGQLLDNMLRAIRLTRGEAADPAQQVYIANTVKCRPPGNRNPSPEELAQCEPFLIRQIELLQPKIILAMGRFAVQSLLRSTEPIGRLRGRVHQYQGVPLIVTYHPAYLLRNLEDKAKAWDDLCLALDVATTPAA
jgi:DNA polymerase